MYKKLIQHLHPYLHSTKMGKWLFELAKMRIAVCIIPSQEFLQTCTQRPMGSPIPTLRAIPSSVVSSIGDTYQPALSPIANTP